MMRRGRNGPAPQIPVSVLNVAPQLLALLRRELLPRTVLAAPIPVHVAHVVAHALALVLAHALVFAGNALLIPLGALRHRRSGGERKRNKEDPGFHG